LWKDRKEFDMLKSEEVSSFLEKAQQLSADWTAQAQFVRDVFLPQMDALNQHISERTHVPEISRVSLTTFMRNSETVGPYLRKAHCINHSANNQQNFHAVIIKNINSSKLVERIFPGAVLSTALGSESDFALYFDAQYKSVMKGLSDQDFSQWECHDTPVRIYTNYDFYIEVKVERTFHEVTLGTDPHHRYTTCAIAAVPLGGENSEHLSFSFVSLAMDQTRLIPTSDSLFNFLKKRKPYIHPVVILDYLRDKPLADIHAFFGNVAQQELAEAKANNISAFQAISAKATEIKALKEARKADAESLRRLQDAHQQQEQALIEQRTKLNNAALRIKKLEIKLKLTEQMYEDLQMRLVEDDLSDANMDPDFGADDRDTDIGSLQTEPTRRV
jgi:hypothetical protein